MECLEKLLETILHVNKIAHFLGQLIWSQESILRNLKCTLLNVLYFRAHNSSHEGMHDYARENTKHLRAYILGYVKLTLVGGIVSADFFVHK